MVNGPGQSGIYGGLVHCQSECLTVRIDFEDGDAGSFGFYILAGS